MNMLNILEQFVILEVFKTMGTMVIPYWKASHRFFQDIDIDGKGWMEDVLQETKFWLKSVFTNYI